MEEDIKNIRDIQEMLGVFDNITQDQLDEAIRKADKEWNEMELNEDIKVLEEFIKDYKELVTQKKEVIIDYKYLKEKVQAIENLINRNKELEAINKMQEYRISVIDERDETDNKIREKIKDLEKEYEKYKGTQGLQYSRAGVVNLQKQILQELLEELWIKI